MSLRKKRVEKSIYNKGFSSQQRNMLSPSLAITNKHKKFYCLFTIYIKHKKPPIFFTLTEDGIR